MIKIIIAGENNNDNDLLANLLSKNEQLLYISGTFRDLDSLSAWLKKNTPPDLIFADFKKYHPGLTQILSEQDLFSPIVFMGDDFLREAATGVFQKGFFWISRSFEEEEIVAALKWYLRLRDKFLAQFISRFEARQDNSAGNRRLVVRKGQEYIPLVLDNISYFYTESHLTFLIDIHGNKYFVDKPLIQLQEMLDRKIFFRATKSHLVNLNGISKFKNLGKGKIEIIMLPEPGISLSVSPHNAPVFKKWIQG
ncbi:MAG: LytTR family transcriptional regulator DNA-binding domain-containing protein [Chitinophagaceae bacterium]